MALGLNRYIQICIYIYMYIYMYHFVLRSLWRKSRFGWDSCPPQREGGPLTHEDGRKHPTPPSLRHRRDDVRPESERNPRLKPEGNGWPGFFWLEPLDKWYIDPHPNEVHAPKQSYPYCGPLFMAPRKVGLLGGPGEKPPGQRTRPTKITSHRSVAFHAPPSPIPRPKKNPRRLEIRSCRWNTPKDRCPRTPSVRFGKADSPFLHKPLGDVCVCVCVSKENAG